MWFTSSSDRGRVDELLRCGIEALLVRLHAEGVALALVDRRDARTRIHPAYWAQRVPLGGQSQWLGIDLVRIRIRPPFSLVFQGVGRLLGCMAAKIAVDDPDRKVDP